jgi:hypothetical protein
MRNHYLFDGQNGGTLSVIECSTPDQVTLRFEQEGLALDIDLTEDDFRQLADLRFKLRFARAETPQLRAA